MPIAQAKANAISPFFLSMNKALEAVGKAPEEGQDAKLITLVVCTDKGLCGSTNNNLTRMLIKQDLSQRPIIIWGDKGCGAFENSIYKQNVKWSAHPDTKTMISFTEVSAVVDQLMKEVPRPPPCPRPSFLPSSPPVLSRYFPRLIIISSPTIFSFVRHLLSSLDLSGRHFPPTVSFVSP